MLIRLILLSCLVFFRLCDAEVARADALENVVKIHGEKYQAPKKATDFDESPRAEEESFLRNERLKKSLEDSNYSILMPLMKERYGKRRDLHIIEIGALRTTALAKTLALNTKLYLGVDGAGPSAAQQFFFDKEGLTNAKAITGDLYNLPIADASQDLVFAARTTPLGSVYATKQSLTRAYSEIARVLKPDGEFVLYPEPRAEIKKYDPANSIFREIKRIAIR